MKAKDFKEALKAIEEEKGISPDIIIEDLKDSLAKAWKKTNDPYAEVRVDINLNAKGSTPLIRMFILKTIVEEVEDDSIQMELEDAQLLNPNYAMGDIVETEVDPEELNRFAARYAAQIMKQKIREAEKNVLYDIYADKVGEIVNGIVEVVDEKYILVNMGKGTTYMPKASLIPNEKYYVGQPIKVYVVGVEKNEKGAQIVISRTDPSFLKRLFEQEIHEIYDGTVEIMSISRDPGERAKVAVLSRNPNVDPTGACIGQNGMRIQKISSQIMGERIDIIKYDEDPVFYIVEALKPAEVYGININVEEKRATVVVKDIELSLAIGKRGQNARLAAKLTGYKVDVKSESAAKEAGIDFITISAYKATLAFKEEAKKAKEEAKKTKETTVTTTTTSTPKEEVYVSPKTSSDTTRVSLFDLEKAMDNKPKQETKKKKVTKVEEEAKEEVKEEVKKMNYMPVYSEEELRELESDLEEDYDSRYDEDVDYEEFDKYYDEE